MEGAAASGEEEGRLPLYDDRTREEERSIAFRPVCPDREGGMRRLLGRRKEPPLSPAIRPRE